MHQFLLFLGAHFEEYIRSDLCNPHRYIRTNESTSLKSRIEEHKKCTSYPSGWPSGLGLGLPCWGSLPAKARGLSSGSSAGYLSGVVCKLLHRSAGFLSCADLKGNNCGFSLVIKKSVPLDVLGI